MWRFDTDSARKRQPFHGSFGRLRAQHQPMLKKALLCLSLLSATAAQAAAAGFLLGFDYSVAFGFAGQDTPTALAVDGSNAVYMLASTYYASLLPATTVLGQAAGYVSFVAKLSSGGGGIVYLTVLGFQANAMAVDPAGNAYIAGPGFVHKLNPTGTAWVYHAPIGVGALVAGVAVDQAGHAYVVGSTGQATIRTSSNAFQPTIPNTGDPHAFVLRLNAAGRAFDYATYLTGSYGDYPSGIAVDASGAAIVAGETASPDFSTTPGAEPGLHQSLHQSTANGPSYAVFLTRLKPDESGLVYSVLLDWADGRPRLAADPAGNATLARYSGDLLLRFGPNGVLAFSKPMSLIGGPAMDTAGNTYALGGQEVRNTLFPCGPGSSALTVFDPSGELLQATYTPSGMTAFILAVGPNSAVYVIGAAGPLAVFAPNPAAQPLQLACVANAASYYPGSIAPGEIVSLFGQGLGPVQGTQPQVDLQSGFPNQVANVQVTFNGVAAPLLYVQDGQINAIVPWALAGASKAQVCALYNGAPTNCLSWAVWSAAPAVFTVDGYHAAALNQDGSINWATNPAKAGSIVSVFATGLGPMNPPQKDGAIVLPPLPANDLQFQVYGRAGGIMFAYAPLETEYTGPAPYLVAGVSQINFTVVDTSFQLTGPSVSNFVHSPDFVVYVAGFTSTSDFPALAACSMASRSMSVPCRWPYLE